MPHYHVYADANIFLDFYRFSDDDLGQLEKLADHIDGDQITLYLPDLTAEEYFRNRDKVILEQLAQLGSSKLQIGIPVFIRESGAAREFSEALKSANEKKKLLLAEAQHNATERDFRADKLISEIFSKAVRIETTDPLIERARLRVQLGNPPGKPNALGDRVNWEALLAAVPDDVDLYLITRDGDYISQFDTSSPNMFLVQEWKKSKNGNVKLFSGIRTFAKIVDETIEFKTDPQKTEAISELAESFSFASTHAVIAKLNQWRGSFLEEEKQQLLQIAMSNSQVGGIMRDNDVNEFYTELRQSGPWFGDPVADAFDDMFPDIDPIPF
jgi:hypothetical protein